MTEWEGSTDHCVEDDSAAPDVDSLGVVTTSTFDHLRCSITRRTTLRFEFLNRSIVETGKTEIDNLESVVMVD